MQLLNETSVFESPNLLVFYYVLRRFVFSCLIFASARHSLKSLSYQDFQDIKWPHPILKSHRLVRIGWGHSSWSGLRGSNSLPPPWQGGALPDELSPRNKKYYSKTSLFCQAFFTFFSIVAACNIKCERTNTTSNDGYAFYRIYFFTINRAKTQ